MRIKCASLIIALFFSKFTFAQSDSITHESRLQYFIRLTSGGLLGKNGSDFSVATIHGVQHKRVALGLGLGYDAYRDWRALPLFASITYDLANSAGNSPFVLLNTGYSKVWMPDANQWMNMRHERGRFINPMAGYKIRAAQWSLLLAVGYKFHRIKYDYSFRWWGGTEPTVYYVQQDIERVVVQIGLGLH